ncbi:hypothetical protein, partial [Cellulomonas sp. B6]|uniref:hypothetical protein n=1 Tax=Cellulomonas sp. B6 TaxID=1295626 RepID=UPI000ABDFBA7
PVRGLGDLTPLTRVVATPWSRIVRGVGLGQHPSGFDAGEAGRIRWSFARLRERVADAHPYTRFAAELAGAALDVARGDPLPVGHVAARVDAVAATARALPTPYERVTAASILLTAVATLGLTADPLVAVRVGPLVRETLAAVDEIRPDQIADENQGRHGDYERVAAWTALLLALAHFEPHELAVVPDDAQVASALASIARVPSPFFRGRGGSTLLSAVAVLGGADVVEEHLRATLAYLDGPHRAELQPAFPSAMSPAFVEAYPLLTTLNAVAVSGHLELLDAGRDRLAQARDLMTAMAPVERTHMALYHVVALDNLGRLDDQLPDLDAFVEDVVGRWRSIDPGRDYFLSGISYAYLVQLAYVTGRTDLVTDAMVERMVTPFARLEATPAGRANRPYPFAYVLNVLGELGLAERLYEPHPAYGGASAFERVVDHLSPGGRAEAARLYMLDHALVSWALRQRPAGSPVPGRIGRHRLVGVHGEPVLGST